jgi:hypothetical protein
MILSAAVTQYKDAERAVGSVMAEQDEPRGLVDAYGTLI